MKDRVGEVWELTILPNVHGTFLVLGHDGTLMSLFHLEKGGFCSADPSDFDDAEQAVKRLFQSRSTWRRLA